MVELEADGFEELVSEKFKDRHLILFNDFFISTKTSSHQGFFRTGPALLEFKWAYPLVCLISATMEDKIYKDPSSAPLYVLTLRWQTEKGTDKRTIGFSTEVDRLEWHSNLERLKEECDKQNSQTKLQAKKAFFSRTKTIIEKPKELSHKVSGERIERSPTQDKNDKPKTPEVGNPQLRIMTDKSESKKSLTDVLREMENEKKKFGGIEKGVIRCPKEKSQNPRSNSITPTKNC